MRHKPFETGFETQSATKVSVIAPGKCLIEQPQKRSIVRRLAGSWSFYQPCTQTCRHHQVRELDRLEILSGEKEAARNGRVQVVG